MANLDSILKSRDVILPTKVHLIKVMYGCESWAVKRLHVKALMLSDCGAREDS